MRVGQLAEVVDAARPLCRFSSTQARRQWQGCVGESAPVRTAAPFSLLVPGCRSSPASPLIFASSAALQPQQGRLPPPCVAGSARLGLALQSRRHFLERARARPTVAASGSEVTPAP